MTAKVEALLFDLGGVFIEVVGAERMVQWCPALGDTDGLWRRWLASSAVRAYESGRATRAQFAQAVIDEFALPVDTAAFLDEFAWWPRRLYDDATTLLQALKPRYRLASLSNTNELHWERFERDWQLPSLFHANFPSSTCIATSAAVKAFDVEPIWKTVSGSTGSVPSTRFTPKPLA